MFDRNRVHYTQRCLSSASDRSKLDFTGSFSIFIISAILATTIQAQDFQDVPGDKLVGRNTLPIAFPNVSRHTPLISLLFWSAYLSFIWEIDTPARAGFTCLAVVVGLRYYLWRSTKADKLSYFLYNVSYLLFYSSLPHTFLTFPSDLVGNCLRTSGILAHVQGIRGTIIKYAFFNL